MAFFKSRSQSNASEDNAQDDQQSMDSLRKQARHRLIGATVLVVIAVVGFPMVFDTKPRELATDIRIDMPERESVRSSQPPVVPQPDKWVTNGVSSADSASAQNPAQATEEAAAVVQAPPAQAPLNKATESKPADNKLSESKSADAKSASNDKPKANASNDSQAVDTKAADKSDAAAHVDRFVVQVGAYSDEAKVKEVRAKLEKAGFSTYVHVAKTKEGARTRVRIGPFARKEEAQKVVAKLKSLNLTAAVLTL